MFEDGFEYCRIFFKDTRFYANIFPKKDIKGEGKEVREGEEQFVPIPNVQNAFFITKNMFYFYNVNQLLHIIQFPSVPRSLYN